jgi:hypothetical protein
VKSRRRRIRFFIGNTQTAPAVGSGR